MNKRINIFLLVLISAFFGILPLSIIAQDSSQLSTTDSFAIKTGEKPIFNPNSGRKSSTAATVPSAATKPAPSGSYKWSGAYIGGQFGYGFGKADTKVDALPSAALFVNLAPTTLKPKPRGFTAGGQGGYLWQSGGFVYGGEIAVAWSNIKGSTTLTPIPQNNGTPFPGAGFTMSSYNMDWVGSARIRLGVATGRSLFYGTAGPAFARIQYLGDTNFRPVGTTDYMASFRQLKTGYVAGGGWEYGLNEHWSLRGEYLYFALGTVTRTVDPTPSLPPFQVRYTWQNNAHTFNGSINYRW